MSAPDPQAPGLQATLRAGLGAGVLSGMLFGLADGLVALRFGPALGPLEVLQCLAAALLLYLALHAAAGLALALGLHAFLRRRPAQRRLGLVLGLLLAAGLFVEAYWWTRPYVYYGIPATSPKRLLAAALLAALALAAGLILGRAGARLPRAFHRGLGLAALLAALAGGVTLAQSWRAQHASSRGELNARNRELPNVLLFVVDALRADVLEPYAGQGSLRPLYDTPLVKTPNVARLAERGIVFENAFVQAPFTWSSFGSLLTGKYPRRHGLIVMDPTRRMALDENVTLPWHLKEALNPRGVRLQDGDYAGATFMTGTLSQGSGLMHGFDWYFEAMAGHELVALDSRWSVYRSNLLVYLLKNKLTQRFDNSLVTSTAVEWLAANEHKRFLGLVHLYSTHTPYDPEEEFRRQYCDPAYDGPIHAFYADSRIALEEGSYTATPADVEQIRNLYYAGVAQADRDIGLVLAELERQGVLDDTLVILTSDHGEELSDHEGYWEHNWMFQTNLRIPLIMSWPAGLAGGRRVDAMVESIDVLPTVCALLGVAPPEEEGEYGRVDGQSLLPLMRGEAEAVKEFSFAENGRFSSVQDRAWKLIVPAEALSEPDAWSTAKAASEPPRLFHLAVDPHETHNAFAEHPEQAERLFAVLAAWDASMPIARSESGRSPRDLETEERFRKLGYTESTGDEGALKRGHAEREH
jgi:arylsulfatase A-like enzyme